MSSNFPWYNGPSVEASRGPTRREASQEVTLPGVGSCFYSIERRRRNDDDGIRVAVLDVGRHRLKAAASTRDCSVIVCLLNESQQKMADSTLPAALRHDMQLDVS